MVWAETEDARLAERLDEVKETELKVVFRDMTVPVPILAAEPPVMVAL